MGLADDLFDVEVQPCKAGRIIAELDDDVREVLEAALAVPEREKATSFIARKLAKNGISIHEDTLRPHRRQACRCFRGIG